MSIAFVLIDIYSFLLNTSIGGPSCIEPNNNNSGNNFHRNRYGI